MKKNHKLTEKDQSLLNDAMKDVTPLKPRNDAPPYKAKPIPPRQNTQHHVRNEDDIIDYFLSDAQDHQLIQSEESMSYSSNGIQPKALKKLRAGKIPIEAHLDLHGLTVDQARQTVSHFIVDCQAINMKCVLIIHGKGSMKKTPLLKSMLNHWLKQIPDVLAFNSAQIAHGGRGAVYVLIKSKT